MSDSSITIVQVGSAIGRPVRSARDAQGPRPGQDRPSRRSVKDTPANRGMIKKVAHLVRVVEGQ